MYKLCFWHIFVEQISTMHLYTEYKCQRDPVCVNDLYLCTVHIVSTAKCLLSRYIYSVLRNIYITGSNYAQIFNTRTISNSRYNFAIQITILQFEFLLLAQSATRHSTASMEWPSQVLTAWPDPEKQVRFRTRRPWPQLAEQPPYTDHSPQASEPKFLGPIR
jgi:hypothetical protein